MSKCSSFGISRHLSAQLLLGFALLAGHLLVAAVLQLFALVVVGSHLQQPGALDLDHL